MSSPQRSACVSSALHTLQSLVSKMLDLGSGPRTGPEAGRSELGAGCGMQGQGSLPGHQRGLPPPTSGFLCTGSQLQPLLGGGAGIIVRKWVPGPHGHLRSLSDGGGGGGGKAQYMGTSDLESLRASSRYHPLSLPAQMESPQPGIWPRPSSAHMSLCSLFPSE